MLLNVVRGPVSFKDIRTVDGVEHPTYMSACKALRLLGDDTEWLESIQEASQWQFGHQLRELFVTILLFCTVTDQAQFFWDCFPFLSEDVAYNQRRFLRNEELLFSDEELVNYTLLHIDDVLNGNGRSLVDFPNLPQIEHRLLNIGSNRLIVGEHAHNVQEERLCFEALYSALNMKQNELALLETDVFLEILSRTSLKTFHIIRCTKRQFVPSCGAKNFDIGCLPNACTTLATSLNGLILDECDNLDEYPEMFLFVYAHEWWDYRNNELSFFTGKRLECVVPIHRCHEVFSFHSDFETVCL
ncbi:unnamed protein product [Lactuca virosa]|uniref:Uncharacterized protein n=1 Tax=Lactuca virosa TaxID=75947 RepID=A0AAU9LNQ3_9ASTR|nr:unnamed protein product [Lactuca virosa]